MVSIILGWCFKLFGVKFLFCILERRLKLKTQQLQDLEKEWAGESKENEDKLKMLHNNIQRKFEEETRLKNELTDLEKYVSDLEGNLSSAARVRERTEIQVSRDSSR